MRKEDSALAKLKANGGGARRHRWKHAYRRRALWYRWSVNGEEYRAYGLDEKPLRAATNYLTYATSEREWIPRLNRPSDPAIVDKIRMHEVLVQAGLPVPQQFLTIEEGDDPQAALRTLRRLHAGPVILKPTQGMQGHGVTGFVELDTTSGSGVTLAGRIGDWADAVRAAQATAPSVVVQDLLRQHSALDPITVQRTSTVRYVTLRRRDGSVQELGGFLRLGMAGAMTDNVSGGGLIVAINTQDGTLGEGLLLTAGAPAPPDPLVARVRQHPEAPAALVGLELPYWDDVRRICREGAQAFRHQHLVGWDVLITESGPVILEANVHVTLWGLQALNGPLLDAELRSAVRSLGVPVRTRMPPLVGVLAFRGARRLWRSLRRKST